MTGTAAFTLSLHRPSPADTLISIPSLLGNWNELLAILLPSTIMCAESMFGRALIKGAEEKRPMRANGNRDICVLEE
jgi:hypothetical protein